MAPYRIRVYGDPVLGLPTTPVRRVDDDLRRLADDMLATMYEAPGVGLAAPQVGVQKRLFVYDAGDGPHVVLNPVLSGHDDEWVFDEGCLSVPGLSWPISRPARVHLDGEDLDGQRISIDADDLLARIFLHECDHLDGVLLLERLDKGERRQAMRTLRNRMLEGGLQRDEGPDADRGRAGRLP